MKRVLVFITAIWLSVAGGSAFAQVRYGVLAGIDAHKLGASPVTFPGSTAGAFVESDGILGSAFRLKAELEYSYSPEYFKFTRNSPPYEDVTRQDRFQQLSFPVMLEYCFLDGRLRVVAGEALACSLYMSTRDVVDGKAGEIHTYNFHSAYLETWRDYIFAGLEYDLSDTVGIRLRYSLGVPDSGSDINFNKGLHLGVNIYL